MRHHPCINPYSFIKAGAVPQCAWRGQKLVRVLLVCPVAFGEETHKSSGLVQIHSHFQCPKNMPGMMCHAWKQSASEAEAEGSRVLGQSELYWEICFRNKLTNQNEFWPPQVQVNTLDEIYGLRSAINCEQNVSQTVLECTHDAKMFTTQNFKMSYIKSMFRRLIHYCLSRELIFVRMPEFWYVNIYNLFTSLPHRFLFLPSIISFLLLSSLFVLFLLFC